MKERSLMRVLFWKIQCPFICFCKPSGAHIYTSGPFKLENSPQSHVVPSTASAAVSNASDDKPSCGVKEESVNGNQQLKSCIRKLPNETDASKEAGKKSVQWMDNLGKQLAEIKEFESSETGDTDNEEESSRCLCVIL